MQNMYEYEGYYIEVVLGDKIRGNLKMIIM